MDKKWFERFAEAMMISDIPAIQLAYLESQDEGSGDDEEADEI